MSVKCFIPLQQPTLILYPRRGSAFVRTQQVKMWQFKGVRCKEDSKAVRYNVQLYGADEFESWRSVKHNQRVRRRQSYTTKLPCQIRDMVGNPYLPNVINSLANACALARAVLAMRMEADALSSALSFSLSSSASASASAEGKAQGARASLQDKKPSCCASCPSIMRISV